MIKKPGKKQDTDPFMLINFTYFHDKQKLLFDTINILEGIQVQDSKNCGCRDIELLQDMIFKYCINTPKLCSNIVARAEVGKFPIEFKVHTNVI